MAMNRDIISVKGIGWKVGDVSTDSANPTNIFDGNNTDGYCLRSLILYNNDDIERNVTILFGDSTNERKVATITLPIGATVELLRENNIVPFIEFDSGLHPLNSGNPYIDVPSGATIKLYADTSNSAEVSFVARWRSYSE